MTLSMLAANMYRLDKMLRPAAVLAMLRWSQYDQARLRKQAQSRDVTAAATQAAAVEVTNGTEPALVLAGSGDGSPEVKSRSQASDSEGLQDPGASSVDPKPAFAADPGLFRLALIDAVSSQNLLSKRRLSAVCLQKKQRNPLIAG